MNATPLTRLSLAVAAAALLAGPSNADTFYVGIDGGDSFSPDQLTIYAGDTVVWVNNDEYFPHTTTSDLSPSNTDYWNGYLYEFEDTYSKTFNNPGTFTYRDTISEGTGTITVNAPPSPGITLNAPQVGGGQFWFEATGLSVGRTNVLEASTNSVQWHAVSTNLAAASSMSFTNPVQPGACFFRLFEQP